MIDILFVVMRGSISSVARVACARVGSVGFTFSVRVFY